MGFRIPGVLAATCAATSVEKFKMPLPTAGNAMDSSAFFMADSNDIDNNVIHCDKMVIFIEFFTKCT